MVMVNKILSIFISLDHSFQNKFCFRFVPDFFLIPVLLVTHQEFVFTSEPDKRKKKKSEKLKFEICEVKVIKLIAFGPHVKNFSIPDSYYYSISNLNTNACGHTRGKKLKVVFIIGICAHTT